MGFILFGGAIFLFAGGLKAPPQVMHGYVPTEHISGLVVMLRYNYV